MEKLIIEARERANSGTGSARAVRREGMVPGIMYGDNQTPQMISVNGKDLARESLHASFYSKLHTLKIGSKEQSVIVKEVQIHPVTDAPLHIDFMRIGKNSKVQVSIPLHFMNEDKAPAVKRGGVFNAVLHQLDISCPADSIPDRIDVDVSVLVEMHSSITLDHIALPKGARAIHAQRDHVIATILAPSGSKDESSEEAA